MPRYIIRSGPGVQDITAVLEPKIWVYIGDSLYLGIYLSRCISPHQIPPATPSVPPAQPALYFYSVSLRCGFFFVVSLCNSADSHSGIIFPLPIYISNIPLFPIHLPGFSSSRFLVSAVFVSPIYTSAPLSFPFLFPAFSPCRSGF